MFHKINDFKLFHYCSAEKKGVCNLDLRDINTSALRRSSAFFASNSSFNAFNLSNSSIPETIRVNNEVLK